MEFGAGRGMMARAVETSHDVDPGASTVVQVAVGESHTLSLTGAVTTTPYLRKQAHPHIPILHCNSITSRSHILVQIRSQVASHVIVGKRALILVQNFN